MPITIEPSKQQTESEFAKLLKKQDEKSKIEEGSLVRGRAVKVSRDFVVVDIGFKSEGQIPISEFTTVNGEITVKEGDTVDVLLENLEDREGMIRLSKERADALKAWDTLVSIQEEGGLVEGTVLAKVKGGLFVNVGVKAFLPGSQVDIRPVRNLDQYVGKKLQFKILKLNKKRGNIVLSRKEALSQNQDEIRGHIMEGLKVGQILEGSVKNVTDYGAFVDLGGMDGLLHVTDMSWGRVHHPGDMFKVGDAIKVMVLKFDEASGRVSLGVKQMQDDPWNEVEGKFPVGSKISGRVVSITDYGAFVELSPGIEGLVHISEISWNKKLKHPSQELKVEETVEAIILDCDLENRRIALGVKQLKENPWDVIEQKMPVGSKVKGTVRNITDFGLFLDCGVGIDGLVHISDISWVQNFNNPQEVSQKGEALEVVVANIDRDNERFSLSRKQLSDNPWETIQARFGVGTQSKGTVVGENPAGIIVALEEGIEGLLPKGEAADNPKTGDALKVEVVLADEENRKLHLKLVS